MRCLRIVVALAMVAVGGTSALAACGDDPGDAAAVAAARADVDTACPCAAAPDHGSHVRCAGGRLRLRVNAGQLSRACAGGVRRCAARSTCGKPGAVTCCRTSATGTTRCSIRRDAPHCTPLPGGSACVGGFASCCDACAAGGCATTTTTTTSSTTSTTEPGCSGGPFSCGGSCPAGLTCAPIGDFPPYCGCVPDGSQACGGAAFPYCNGTCPAGEHCGSTAPVPDAACFCLPDGMTACGQSSQPTCSGVCPAGGQQCQHFRVSTFDFCGCADGAVSCACSTPGVCPPGSACEFVDGACGCAP